MDNTRLYSRSLRMVESTWTVRDEPKDRERAFKLLREYQEAEPSGDWILETRGTVAGWHEWKPSDK